MKKMNNRKNCRFGSLDYWTLDKLRRQERLKMFGHPSREMQTAIERTLNNELACCAVSAIDWAVNFDNARVEIWCDADSYTIYVSVPGGRRFRFTQDV